MLTGPHRRPLRIAKSPGLAYALLLFAGQLGWHRFYLERPGSGAGQAVLGLGGWSIALGFDVGGPVRYVPLALLVVWWIADFFMLDGMIDEANH